MSVASRGNHSFPLNFPGKTLLRAEPCFCLCPALLLLDMRREVLEKPQCNWCFWANGSGLVSMRTWLVKETYSLRANSCKWAHSSAGHLKKKKEEKKKRKKSLPLFLDIRYEHNGGLGKHNPDVGICRLAGWKQVCPHGVSGLDLILQLELLLSLGRVLRCAFLWRPACAAIGWLNCLILGSFCSSAGVCYSTTQIQHLPSGNSVRQLERSAEELKWVCRICQRSGWCGHQIVVWAASFSFFSVVTHEVAKI